MDVKPLQTLLKGLEERIQSLDDTKDELELLLDDACNSYNEAAEHIESAIARIRKGDSSLPSALKVPAPKGKRR